MKDLVIGQRYGKFKKTGERVSFSFGERVGIFKGIVPSGFLNFRLSDDRECIDNPNSDYIYEELKDCQS